MKPQNGYIHIKVDFWVRNSAMVRAEINAI